MFFFEGIKVLHHRFGGAFFSENNMKSWKKVGILENLVEIAWKHPARVEFGAKIAVFALCAKQYKTKPKSMFLHPKPEIHIISWNSTFHVKCWNSVEFRNSQENQDFMWNAGCTRKTSIPLTNCALKRSLFNVGEDFSPKVAKFP